MAPAPIEQTKACTKCGEVKPHSGFHREKQKSDGLRADCKVCATARRRAYYANNREAERQRYEDWRKRNPTYHAEWHKLHEPRLKAKASAYYRENIEQYRENSKRWREENRPRVRELDLESYYRRQATAKGRLDHAMSAVVWRSLKKAKGGRGTFDILGYGLADLMAHLERQFRDGMTWGNYGEWHVDHILPLASFNYETPDCPNFRAAWALANLRPLWAKENLTKNAKRLTLL